MPTTSNFGWTTPADTDLVKDGAAAIRTLGNGIDTSFLDLKGGTTDQVLAKNSNTDLDFKWVAADDVDAIQKSLIDAEGDLIVGDAADAVQRLAIGSNGNVLTVDTAVDGKIKWAAPAAGGKVLQVVTATYSTQTNIASTSFTDTGLNASITPSAATSKILVLAYQQSYIFRGATNIDGFHRLMRGATTVQDFDDTMKIGASGVADCELGAAATIVYLDSPSSTSSLNYKIQARVGTTANFAEFIAQRSSGVSTITLMEIGA